MGTLFPKATESTSLVPQALILVVMKFSLLFMAFLAFSSSAMSMSLSGTAGNNNAVNEADWLNLLSENRFEKRKFSPTDPRSLFASVYANYDGAGYKKRYNTPPAIEDLYYAPPAPISAKRGLRNPNDPRNLFRAVYGWRK